jgi:phosphopantothenoylcysteine decarboxylase/phosphopantothenate--cysteine ligase
LLGVTGSVAAYKAGDVVRQLVKRGTEVQVILTEGGSHFITAQTLEALSGRVVVRAWTGQAEIAHVETGYRTDLALVAPATAHTLAKLAHGWADDPLTATLLSFDGPTMVAPAMETRMWRHPATQANVRLLRDRGVDVLGPVAGDLASGRQGEGRMLDPEEIVEAVVRRLAPSDLDGQRFVITAGPTREPIDPVRFLGNRSTGRMGIEIARQAALRGASVELVLGPTSLDPPGHPRVRVHRVETAEQMRAAVRSVIDQATVFIGAAAVSDFRPAHPRESKLKKGGEGADHLALRLNPDILAEVAAAARPGQWMVGFAAETEDVVENARRKREAKGVHAIVANQVSASTGFGAGETEVVWVESAEALSSGRGSKAQAASFVLDRVSLLVRQDPST